MSGKILNKPWIILEWPFPTFLISENNWVYPIVYIKIFNEN